MAQKCVVVARKNPLKPEELPKFYALAKSKKNVPIDDICKRISERSSYSRGELLGCISEFLIEVEHVLEEGNIAELSTLGHFSLGARTKTPTDTAEEFKSTHVRDAKVRFYPGTALRALCKTVKFEIERTEADTTSGGSGSDNQGGGGDSGGDDNNPL